MARVNSGTQVSGDSRTGGPMLEEAVTALLPTPRASERHTREATPESGTFGETLPSVIVKLLQTPHGMPKEGQARRPGPSGNELGHALGSLSTGASTDLPSDDGSRSTGLRLNRSFVEWMIGAPPGWSDSDCPLSATEFRSRSGTSSGAT
jgi:hypothetical protein